MLAHPKAKIKHLKHQEKLKEQSQNRPKEMNRIQNSFIIYTKIRISNIYKRINDF